MLSLCLVLLMVPVSAQDLDSRAYDNVPVNATFLVSGFSLSNGGAVTDPTLPVTGIIRCGADFSTVSFGWQTAWVPQSTPTR